MSAGETHLDALALEALRTGEGAPEERAHLEACAPCRRELAELERLAAGLGEALAPPFEIPAELDVAIRALGRERAAEIRARKVLRPARWIRLRSSVPTALVASLIVGVVGVVLLDRGERAVRSTAASISSSAARIVPWITSSSIGPSLVLFGVLSSISRAPRSFPR